MGSFSRRGGASGIKARTGKSRRVFIQISRHSIKQSICSGFASARTSAVTWPTCKFAGIRSNSSRLGASRPIEGRTRVGGKGLRGRWRMGLGG